jgi:hypothetical protein
MAAIVTKLATKAFRNNILTIDTIILTIVKSPQLYYGHIVLDLDASSFAAAAAAATDVINYC